MSRIKPTHSVNSTQGKLSIPPPQPETAMSQEVPTLVIKKVMEQKLKAYERTTPHSARERKEYEDLKRLLRAIDQQERGTISEEQRVDVFRDIREQHGCYAPAPAWLPQEFELVLLWVLLEQRRNPLAGKEFLAWAKRVLAEPKGRPANDELGRIYKDAARMKRTLDRKRNPPSWAMITRKLCPQRNEDGHKCTKLCVDRIRQGAAQYE